VSVPRLLRLADGDNVYVAAGSLRAGTQVPSDTELVLVREDIELGHKVAARDIEVGTSVVRAGMAIGVATRPIQEGDWVHTHNLVSTYIRTFDHRGGEDGA
jgi:hypothetical protein